MPWLTLPPRRWFIRKAAPLPPDATGLPAMPPATKPPTPAKLPMASSDWQLLLDEADDAAPQMQAALEHAFTWDELPMDVRLAILDGNPMAAVTHLTTALEGAVAEHYLPAFQAIAEDLFTAVVEHQTPYALEMFSALKPAAAPMTTHFPDDLLAPRAIEYIQQEGLKQVKGIVTTSMEGIRPILMASIAEGTPIPKVVQQITPLLALGPHQVKTLANYAQTIQGLPQDTFQAKLQAMHTTLRRRRARVIARTETMAALNVGIDAFWNIAPLAAGLPQTALRRFWMITNDAKTCPHCQPIPGLNPQGVGLDEPFKTPQGPAQRPPLHPQCRCVLAVRPTVLAAPELLAPKPMPSTPMFPEYVEEAPYVPPPPPPPVAPPAPKVKKPKAPPKPKPPGPYASLDLGTLQFELSTTKNDLKYGLKWYTDDQIAAMKLKIKQINAEIKLKTKAQMVAPPPPPTPAPTPPDPYASLTVQELHNAYTGVVAAFNNPALQGQAAILEQLKQDMQTIAGHLKVKGGTAPAASIPAPPPPVPPPAVPQVSQSWGATDLSPPWATTPPPHFWEKVADVDLGPTPAYPTGKVSTGVVMIEDGKVWVYEPKNHYGGYSTAFPKGAKEPGLTPQQNALKEVWEETGLHAQITGFLGDFKATSGTTRLYLGAKVGGNPTRFGDETWSVKLLTPADLEQALQAQQMSYPLDVLTTLQAKGLIAATPGMAPQAAPTAAAPPTPTPPPVKLPIGPADIEESVVRGEFVQKLGGSTGAELWRGTDGKLRAIKRPDKDQAYQEFLANRIYRELGIEAPAQQLVMVGKKIVGVASEWVDNTQTLQKAGLTKERADKILEGFAADVWLANRDAIGLTLDNILVAGSNRLIRIDNGGSLQYRAQGTPKPAEWLKKLDEWEGSSNPQKNASYAAVFREAGVKTADLIPTIKQQIQQILDLRQATNGYRDLVPAMPGITATKRTALVQLLNDRAILLEDVLGRLTPQMSDVQLKAELQRLMGSKYTRRAERMRSKVPNTVGAPDTMAEHEKVAIGAYTSEDSQFSYKTMNPTYWSKWDAPKSGYHRKAEQDAAQQRLAPLNQSAINGMAKLKGMKPGTIAYHGQSHMTDKQIEAVRTRGILEFEGFASTSSKKEVTYGFGGLRHLFVIVSAGGNKDVRSISDYSQEAEFLYPPTARFRVKKDYMVDTQHVYEVEEMTDVNKREPIQKQEPALPPWTKWVDEYGDVQQQGWGPDTTDAELEAFARDLVAEVNAMQLTPAQLRTARRFANKMDSAGLHVEGEEDVVLPPEDGAQ